MEPTSTETARIGLLGGTFNPVHIGHLIMAQNAVEAFELDRIIFIPCHRPPHKASPSLAPAEDRLAMLEAAVEHDLQFEVSDIEIRRGGTSYTVDTLRWLVAEHPDTEFFFVVGSDSLRELHTWKHVAEILELCTIVAFERPARGRNAPVTPEDVQLPEPWPRRLIENMAPGRLIEVSSSEIRHRVAEGLSIRYLVPPETEIYIAEHHLYTS